MCHLSLARINIGCDRPGCLLLLSALIVIKLAVAVGIVVFILAPLSARRTLLLRRKHVGVSAFRAPEQGGQRAMSDAGRWTARQRIAQKERLASQAPVRTVAASPLHASSRVLLGEAPCTFVQAKCLLLDSRLSTVGLGHGKLLLRIPPIPTDGHQREPLLSANHVLAQVAVLSVRNCMYSAKSSPEGRQCTPKLQCKTRETFGLH